MKNWAVGIANKLLLPIAPRSYGLSIDYWANRLQGWCEPELVHLSRYADGTGIAVDAGANIGHYSYSLAKIYKTVYAFEINDDVLGKLSTCNIPNIQLMRVGLSRVAGEATLHIPMSKGRTLTGWASLDASNCPDAEKMISKQVKLSTLDSFALDEVGFLKIDVEGHEVELLQGASQTIERCEPIILIETKADNLPLVQSFLESRSYVMKRLVDLIGIEGQDDNYIFMPKRKQ